MSREIKNILLTGGTGTLGSELKPLLQEAGYNVLSPTHEEMPIECMIAVGDFGRYNKVDLILHCAAYTDVKGAMVMLFFIERATQRTTVPYITTPQQRLNMYPHGFFFSA